MKPKHSVLFIVSGLYAVFAFCLFGCAGTPHGTPSTAVMAQDRHAAMADIHQAQTCTQQADAKAEVILQYLKSSK